MLDGKELYDLRGVCWRGSGKMMKHKSIAVISFYAISVLLKKLCPL
jgi:hypothetical protein